MLLVKDGQYIEAWRQKEYISSLNKGDIKLAISEVNGNEVLGFFIKGACIENNVYEYVEINNTLYVYGQTGYTVISLEDEAIKQMILWDNAPIYYYKDYLTNYSGINSFIDFTKDEQFYFNSFELKEIILKRLDCIAHAIEKKDMEELSVFVHPEKGVRFSDYGYVDMEHDVVISKEELKNFFNNVYTFIYCDEFDDMPSYVDNGYDYFMKKIFFSDFSQAKIGYNKNVEMDNYLSYPGNHFEVYEKVIMVELFFKNNYPEGFDWKIIRFIFEKYEDVWVLVGIVNDEWTP